MWHPTVAHGLCCVLCYAENTGMYIVHSVHVQSHTRLIDETESRNDGNAHTNTLDATTHVNT